MYAVTSPVVAGPSERDLTSSTTLSLEFEYVQLLRKVMYITEFVVRLNYVEVVIPCIFCEYAKLLHKMLEAKVILTQVFYPDSGVFVHNVPPPESRVL